MSLPAPENIWEGMTGGKEVPDYMKYLRVGDYTGLPDVYLSFGGDELFLAGAESIRKRLEEYKQLRMDKQIELLKRMNDHETRRFQLSPTWFCGASGRTGCRQRQGGHRYHGRGTEPFVRY